jgi:hypothetical protein
VGQITLIHAHRTLENYILPKIWSKRKLDNDLSGPNGLKDQYDVRFGGFKYHLRVCRERGVHRRELPGKLLEFRRPDGPTDLTGESGQGKGNVTGQPVAIGLVEPLPRPADQRELQTQLAEGKSCGVHSSPSQARLRLYPRWVARFGRAREVEA